MARMASARVLGSGCFRSAFHCSKVRPATSVITEEAFGLVLIVGFGAVFSAFGAGLSSGAPVAGASPTTTDIKRQYSDGLIKAASTRAAPFQLRIPDATRTR